MKSFRRCGLEDDDGIGASPATLRSRPTDDPVTRNQSFGAENATWDWWEEESVVSTMTTESDLVSVYKERSSKFRPMNLREQLLLQQALPDPTRSVSRILSERDRRPALRNISATTPTNEVQHGNNSDDTIDNLWLDPRPRQPRQMVYPGKAAPDPQEKQNELHHHTGTPRNEI